jgi:hypothetical protein
MTLPKLKEARFLLKPLLPVYGLATSGTVFCLGTQSGKCIRCDPFEHTAALDFLGDGRDKAFTIEIHMELFSGTMDDLRDMEWTLGGKEYVVGDTHLGPTSYFRLRAGFFSLSQELTDGFQL